MSLPLAQDLYSFHEEAIKQNAGKVRWNDYEKIQRIQKSDIPEIKKTMERNIAWVDTAKNQDGSPLTPEQKVAAKADWIRYLSAVNDLEASWRSGKLVIENHREENYAATKEKTRAKLTELFGEVQAGGASNSGPRESAPALRSITAESFIEEALGYMNDPDKLKAHLATIDGKITQASKDELLKYIDGTVDYLESRGFAHQRNKVNQLKKLRYSILALKLESEVKPVVAPENTPENLLKGVRTKLDTYAKSQGYTSIKLEGTGTFMKDASAVEVYKITLNRKVTLNGASSDASPIILDGISLQKGHLGPLKSPDELYTEIVKKIENALRQVEGVRENSLEANKRFIAANQSAIEEAIRKVVDKQTNEKLRLLLANPTGENIKELQGIIKQDTPNGIFDVATLAALKKFAGVVDTPPSIPVPAPGATPGDRPARRPSESAEGNIDAINKRYLEQNRKRFDQVVAKLASSTGDAQILGSALDSYTADPSQANALALQKLINNKFHKGIDEDKKVGPLTLTALESIAGIQGSAPAPVWGGGAGRREGTPDSRPTRPRPNPLAGGRPGAEEPGMELDPASAAISFTREGGRIVLNARDKQGNLVQGLSYEALKKLSPDTLDKDPKINERMKGERNQLILLSTIADVWVQAANKDMNSMVFGSFRADGKIKYQNQIKAVSDYIGGMQQKFLKKESVQSDIFNAYGVFNGANEGTGGLTPPISVNDLRKALNIVQASGTASMDQRRADILKMLSSAFNVTATEGVQKTAMEEVVNMKEFADLKKKLSDPEFMSNFVSGDSKQWLPILKQTFGLSENVAYNLARELRDVRKGMASHDDEIRSALSAKGVPNDKIDTQIQGAKNVALRTVLSKYVIDSKIDTVSGNYADVYKTASRDLTTNKIIDFAVQLAISLVPMGGGMLAVRGAAALGSKVLPSVAASAGRTAGLARVAGEGVAFYEGFNLTNNLLRNQDTENKLGGAFEGATDIKELVKSMAMVGVIRGMGMVPGGMLSKLQLQDKALMSRFAVESLKVAGISAGVVATSQGIEAMFGGEFNPTPEEFAQAVIMTALFRNIPRKNIPKTEVSKEPKPAAGHTVPEGYTTETITSKAGIKEVRARQSADPSYKPQIVDASGNVLTVESVRGSNGRETLTVKDSSGKTTEITANDLISGKYKALAKMESGVKVESGSPNVEKIQEFFQKNKDAINNGRGEFMQKPDGSYHINNVKILGSKGAETASFSVGKSFYEMPLKDFAKWQSDMASTGKMTYPDASYRAKPATKEDAGAKSEKPKPAAGHTVPEGYTTETITSKAGIKEVRARQSADPSYKPQIVDASGNVLTVESVRGSNGRETITVKDSSGKISEITADDLISGKYKALVESTPQSKDSPKGPKGVDIEKFTTRQISGKDIRAIQKVMESDPNLFPQFIAKDGTIWSIRSIKGTNASNTIIEIGPLGEPSVARRATQQEFITGVNRNVTDLTASSIPSQRTFSTMEAAKIWIAEHQRTAIGGLWLMGAIAIAGSVYMINQEGKIVSPAATLNDPATGAATLNDPATGAATLNDPATGAATLNDGTGGAATLP